MTPFTGASRYDPSQTTSQQSKTIQQMSFRSRWSLTLSPGPDFAFAAGDVVQIIGPVCGRIEPSSRLWSYFGSLGV